MTVTRGLKNKSGPRPIWEKFYPYFLILFLGFATADVLILAFRDRMLPTQAPPAKIKNITVTTGLDRGSFNTIISRNIFSSTGVIPPSLQGENGGEKDAPPVLSQLPLTLVGTLVHSDATKSIASIDVKSKNQVISFTAKKEIEGIATVEKVERMKVIIRNLNSNKLEYLEIKNDSHVSFGTAPKAAITGGGGDIVKKISDNEFHIKKDDLKKQLDNFNEIIRQAKAIPATDASGNIYGFRITQIEPGSIYTQLNINNGDVITGVNGNPVTSTQQALEMYQTMKNSDNIEIQVERDGRRQMVKYQVTK